MITMLGDSTHAIDPGRSLAGEVLRWTLPRLGIYVFAAIASVAAFAAWAAVYTYVWPGRPQQPSEIQQRLPPIPPPSVIETPAPAAIPTPQIPPTEPKSAEMPMVRVLPAEAVIVGAQIFDTNDVLVGRVGQVNTDAQGRPQEIIVSLEGRMQGDLTVPIASVEWRGTATIDPSNAAAPRATRGVIPYSIADIQNATQAATRQYYDAQGRRIHVSTPPYEPIRPGQ